MLRNLMAEMARRGISNNDLSAATGKSGRSIYDKLKGRYEFSLPEAAAIRDKYFVGMALEYLFAEDSTTQDSV